MITGFTRKEIGIIKQCLVIALVQRDLTLDYNIAIRGIIEKLQKRFPTVPFANLDKES